ncbi:methyl-accepting chemotaxis protein [Aquincola tertiaricarbonis]|uniref:methyl-accepting chemotaxis protein n=1 Tax=Aquincola tertiaricarbonis TaxID=391953 RepID=UPI0028738D89|nr:methyl-accepting chemotaxis protein [Aquincola tertiaricarbonis]
MNSLSLSRRLTLSFALLLLLLAAVAGLGLYRMSQIQASLENIAYVNNEQARLAVKMRVSINQVATYTRNVVLIEDDAGMAAEMERLKQARQRYDEADKALEVAFQHPNTTPEEKALFAKIRELRATTRPLVDKVLAHGLKNETEQAKEVLLREVTGPQGDWLTALGELADLEDKLNANEAAAAREHYQTGRNLSIAMTLLALVIGAVAATLIVRSVQRQLGAEPDYALEVVRRIASGDLSQPIALRPGDRGSLLSAMQEMQQFLARMVKDIRSGSESIATGSNQIAIGNADLSQRTEEQASNLQQTAASMEQMNATVKSNADTARQASQLSSSASAVALQGGEVVGKVTTTMGQITDASKRIADIIGVIDGIAFQTNILALNAAVEAARAGEQGRGFAVVAGEVRSLASRSAEAAKEIKGLISHSVQTVESGSQLVDEAGRTMADIVGQVRRVSDLLAEISASTIEQTSGIGQVNDAVTQLDQVTQQNAALVEESAAAADSLRMQADRLVQTVAAFRTA